MLLHFFYLDPTLITITTDLPVVIITAIVRDLIETFVVKAVFGGFGSLTILKLQAVISLNYFTYEITRKINVLTINLLVLDYLSP